MANFNQLEPAAILQHLPSLTCACVGSPGSLGTVSKVLPLKLLVSTQPSSLSWGGKKVPGWKEGCLGAV